MRHPLMGVVFAFIAAIGFSAKAIFVKLAYGYAVDAITLLALRMAFSIPFFLLAAVLAGRNQSTQVMQVRDWLAVIMLGLIGYYLASFLDFLGLQHIGAGLERLILFLYPTMVVLISALLFRQKISIKTMLALLLSYVGIALVFLHEAGGGAGGMVLGSALVFASALAYAIYLVGAGHTIARIGATRFTAYAMTVACVAALLQFIVTRPLFVLDQPAALYGLCVGMALFSTVLPAFALGAAIRRIGSARTSMIGAIGPIATIYLAYIFLGERLSVTQLAGSALVMAGILMISLRNRSA